MWLNCNDAVCHSSPRGCKTVKTVRMQPPDEWPVGMCEPHFYCRVRAAGVLSAVLSADWWRRFAKCVQWLCPECINMRIVLHKYWVGSDGAPLSPTHGARQIKRKNVLVQPLDCQCLAIWVVLVCKIGRFGLQYGSFCNAKWPILENRKAANVWRCAENSIPTLCLCVDPKRFRMYIYACSAHAFGAYGPSSAELQPEDVPLLTDCRPEGKKRGKARFIHGKSLSR